MATYYVVNELGFQYNDEIYYKPELNIKNVGRPKFLFNTKEEADKVCKEQNIKEFKEILLNSIAYYAYSADEIININEDTNNIFNKFFGKDVNSWWDTECQSKMIITPTEEDWENLYDCFTLAFYEVVTVKKVTAFD